MAGTTISTATGTMTSIATVITTIIAIIIATNLIIEATNMVTTIELIDTTNLSLGITNHNRAILNQGIKTKAAIALPLGTHATITKVADVMNMVIIITVTSSK